MRIKKEYFHHFLLWILILGIILGLALVTFPFDKEGFQFNRFFIVSMIYLLFYMLAFYSNLFFFFPKFYKESKNYRYLTFISIWIIVLTIAVVQVEYDYIKQFHVENTQGEGGMRPDIRWVLAAKNFCWITCMVLASTYLKIQERMRQIIEERNRLQHEQLQMELKLLKAQINPHFLFNALNDIYALAYLKSDKAPESVLMLSGMLRYVLEDCSVESVSLSSEVHYIENYIAFQKMKSSAPMKVDFDKSALNPNLKISPMLFIPFVENSFKYSKIGESEDAYIHIVMKTENDKLSFSIVNSIAAVPAKSGANLGIANVKQHLETIYPNKHILRIEKENQCFSVFLQLNLNV